MKNKVRSVISRMSAAATLFILSVSQVSAFLDPTDRPAGTAQEPFRNAAIRYLNYLLSFLGLLAVLMIVYAGIMMVTAAGDEEQTKKGKTIIMWAGIGIITILLSYTIVNWVVGIETGG